MISFAERRASRRAAGRAGTPAAQHGTRARVAAVTDTCWCCRSKVRAIVGVIVEPEQTSDGSGFLPLESVDEALIRVLDERTLSRRGIGSLRHRESPGVEGGYIANGCAECDALIGRFHLEDLLTDHRMRRRLLRPARHRHRRRAGPGAGRAPHRHHRARLTSPGANLCAQASSRAPPCGSGTQVTARRSPGATPGQGADWRTPARIGGPESRNQRFETRLFAVQFGLSPVHLIE